MNEKTARQIAEMKNQTIGVEVEMNSITRQKAAKVAAAYFGTGRYENTAGRNGYSTWSAWDAQGREWKFQKDVSIAGPDEQKCELVTPILTYGDIETLQELCRQLRHAGAKSDASRGCGVHIHIGAQGRHPCRTAQKLHSALPGPEPDGEGCADGKPQTPAERKPQIRHENLAPPPGLHRWGVCNGQRFPDPQPDWGHRLPARQSRRLKDTQELASCHLTFDRFGGLRVVEGQVT